MGEEWADDFDAFVAIERDTYEAEYGSFETATERLAAATADAGG